MMTHTQTDLTRNLEKLLLPKRTSQHDIHNTCDSRTPYAGCVGTIFSC